MENIAAALSDRESGAMEKTALWDDLHVTRGKAEQLEARLRRQAIEDEVLSKMEHVKKISSFSRFSHVAGSSASLFNQTPRPPIYLTDPSKNLHCVGGIVSSPRSTFFPSYLAHPDNGCLSPMVCMVGTQAPRSREGEEMAGRRRGGQTRLRPTSSRLRETGTLGCDAFQWLLPDSTSLLL